MVNWRSHTFELKLLKVKCWDGALAWFVIIKYSYYTFFVQFGIAITTYSYICIFHIFLSGSVNW